MWCSPRNIAWQWPLGHGTRWHRWLLRRHKSIRTHSRHRDGIIRPVCGRRRTNNCPSLQRENLNDFWFNWFLFSWYECKFKLMRRTSDGWCGIKMFYLESRIMSTSGLWRELISFTVSFSIQSLLRTSDKVQQQQQLIKSRLFHGTLGVASTFHSYWWSQYWQIAPPPAFDIFMYNPQSSSIPWPSQLTTKIA